jgi:hypothetical protein
MALLLCFANVRSSQVAEETLQQEREHIRQLHQSQQDSLKNLYELERKFEEFAHAGTGPMQDENVTSRGATLKLTSPPPSQEALPMEQISDEASVNVFLSSPILGPSSFDSTKSATDEKNEHLSLEELVKAAEHVQQLLDHITQLQSSFDATSKSKIHHKGHVDKLYREFCRKWEEDIVVLPNNPDEPSLDDAMKPIDLSDVAISPRYLIRPVNQSKPGPESPIQSSIPKTQKIRAAVLRWRLRAKAVVGSTQTESAQNPELATPLANTVPGLPVENLCGGSDDLNFCARLPTPASGEKIPTLPAEEPDLPIRGRPRVRQWFTSAASHLGNPSHQKIDISDYKDTNAHDFPEIPGEPLRNPGLGGINYISEQYNLLREVLSKDRAEAESNYAGGVQNQTLKNTLEAPTPTPVQIHMRRSSYDGYNSTLNGFESPGPDIGPSRRSERRDMLEIPSAIYMHRRSSIQDIGDEGHQRDIVDLLLEQWTTIEPGAGKSH